MLGVVKLFVVASAVPPVDAAYHSMVAPAGGVAARITVPVAHLAAGVTVGSAGTEFTVAVIASRLADTHPVAEVTTSA